METSIEKIRKGTENPEKVYKMLTLITDWCYINQWMRSYNKLMTAERQFNSEKQWKKKS